MRRGAGGRLPSLRWATAGSGSTPGPRASARTRRTWPGRPPPSRLAGAAGGRRPTPGGRRTPGGSTASPRSRAATRRGAA
uniref:Uncharacterized protein n=1 Tax=Arundo donax TaxID=35708 RepID=A0A0A8ZDU1_ARUDO